jgi:hypothetical protein
MDDYEQAVEALAADLDEFLGERSEMEMRAVSVSQYGAVGAGASRVEPVVAPRSEGECPRRTGYMAELVSRRFRVTLDVTVSVRAIDDALAEETRRRFNNDALARDPWTEQLLARDRRLLMALLSDSEALAGQLIRHVAWTLDPVQSTDQMLADLGGGHLSDAQLIGRLRPALSQEAYDELRVLCEEDVLYDNTTFYQDAFTTHVGNFRLLGSDEGGVSEP